MGTCLSVHYKTVKVKHGEQEEFIKCVPSYRYRGFPQTLKKPAFSLLLEKSAVREDTFEGIRVSYCDLISGFCWTDAQFSPNNDATLFVTGEVFAGEKYVRKVHTGRPIPFSIAKIMALSIEDDNDVKFNVHSGENVAAYSKLQIHPSERYIGYVGIGRAYTKVSQLTTYHQTITSVDGKEMLRDLIHSNLCRSLAFAPNGKLLAKILISGMYSSTLVLTEFDKGIISNVRSVKLNIKRPRCLNRDEAKYIATFHWQRLKDSECKWSQDSKHIAVCCGATLFIFNNTLEQVFDISEALQYTRQHYTVNPISSQIEEVQGVLQDEIYRRINTCKFDFDPRSCHELLAFGTADHRVLFINTATKQINAETHQLSSRSTDYIDSLQYHPFGKYAAVGTRNFKIYFVDPNEGIVLHSLDMRAECPDLPKIAKYYPSIMRISFSATGEQLVTSTSDAKVRVYQMPEELSLFDICKWVILSLVPQTKLQTLSFPKLVINKLLAIPVMK